MKSHASNRTEHDARVLTAARKAQSHMTKVVNMLEEGHYCIDVLQQSLAVQGLWKGVIRKVLLRHIDTCYAEAARTKNQQRQEEIIQEIEQVLRLADRA